MEEHFLTFAGDAWLWERVIPEGWWKELLPCLHSLIPQEARLAENTCTLADLTEGQVGKLLIRKSGKVQLLLGKVTLDVTMGTACSFLQVSVQGPGGIGSFRGEGLSGLPVS